MKNLIYFFLSLSLTLSLYSCASADKMLETGNYDGLVNLAVNKLSGKKKKEVYVTALEEGFEKITRHDMARGSVVISFIRMCQINRIRFFKHT